MNTDEYITSGILHDFCLGLLTNEEEKKVEAMCYHYPQIAEELSLLRQAIEKYADIDKTVHRIELREAMWKNVKKIWEGESSQR
jgi:hypothetical protein